MADVDAARAKDGMALAKADGAGILGGICVQQKEKS